MQPATSLPTLEQVKAALAADGRPITDEQAAALLELMQSMGGAGLARVAVELLADLKDAA
jgi:hypothetical protein